MEIVLYIFLKGVRSTICWIVSFRQGNSYLNCYVVLIYVVFHINLIFGYSYFYKQQIETEKWMSLFKVFMLCLFVILCVDTFILWEHLLKALFCILK